MASTDGRDETSVDAHALDGACGCDCPADARIERYFDRKTRQRLAAGETATLGPVSRRLLDALLAHQPAGRSVLEAGCGRGELLRQLLLAGAARATGIDLSSASIEDARSRARDAGVTDRAEFTVGDAATAPLQRHDWVILDKVFCCYRHADRLLENSLAAAGSVYAFSLPTSRGIRGVLARIWGWVEDGYGALRGTGCRSFVHDVGLIERRMSAAGFRQVHREVIRLWDIAVFAR